MSTRRAPNRDREGLWRALLPFLLQQIASLLRAARVYGLRTAIDVLDNTLLIHHERRTIRDPEEVKNTVSFGHRSSSVAE